MVIKARAIVTLLTIKMESEYRAIQMNSKNYELTKYPNHQKYHHKP